MNGSFRCHCATCRLTNLGFLFSYFLLFSVLLFYYLCPAFISQEDVRGSTCCYTLEDTCLQCRSQLAPAFGLVTLLRVHVALYADD